MSIKKTIISYNYKISFIILTLNSQKYLERCLDSITNQKYKDFEIIVIDSGSTDKTCSIIQSQQKKSMINIYFYEKPHSTIGQARQIGTERSNGDYCAFIDSDCELPSDQWLSNMMMGFDRDDIAGVWAFGAFHKSDPALMRYSILSNPYRNKVPSLVDIKNYVPVGTGHTIIKKNSIIEVGGFRGINAAEDIELTYDIVKRGYKFRYMHGNEVFHYHVTSLHQLLKKTKRNILGGLNSNIWLKTYYSSESTSGLFLNITIIYPLFYAAYYTLKDRDIAWFWHPVVTFYRYLLALAIIINQMLKK